MRFADFQLDFSDPRNAASVNDVIEEFGGTPLHIAAWFGRLSFANTLIDMGADIDAKTKVASHMTSHYMSLCTPLHSTRATSSPLKLVLFLNA